MWHPYKYVQINKFCRYFRSRTFCSPDPDAKARVTITNPDPWLFRRIFLTGSKVEAPASTVLSNARYSVMNKKCRKSELKLFLFFALAHRIGFDLKTNDQKVTAEELTWHQSDQTIEFELKMIVVRTGGHSLVHADYLTFPCLKCISTMSSVHDIDLHRIRVASTVDYRIFFFKWQRRLVIIPFRTNKKGIFSQANHSAGPQIFWQESYWGGEGWSQGAGEPPPSSLEEGDSAAAAVHVAATTTRHQNTFSVKRVKLKKSLKDI
jgi:hypothetical protein